MFREDSDEEDKQPTNSYDVIFKRRLYKFKSKPWIIPDFLKIQRPILSGGGDLLVVNKDIDAARIAQCKSKKVKNVYEMMKALTAQDQQAHVGAYNSGAALSKRINESTWLRGQKVLSKKKGGMFGGDEDDGGKLG